MSDLADRAAESCGAVEGMRGVFVVAPLKGVTGMRGLPPCECGGRPGYRPHPPMRAGQPCETLACGTCGNAVGPLASRQALAMAWRSGGWRKDEGGRMKEGAE